jgi:hypothetical protein
MRPLNQILIDLLKHFLPVCTNHSERLACKESLTRWTYCDECAAQLGVPVFELPYAIEIRELEKYEQRSTETGEGTD